MEIRPFRGWRYNTEAVNGDISNVLAPPYDVLTAADKADLLSRSDSNIVAVDMPQVPPTKAGPDEVYQAAAAALADWTARGVIKQEESDAIYIYEQTFTWAGQTHTRKAMICGVRATKMGEDIIPHEHTFAGPKADRLKLTKFTKRQLSPIFGFYEDAGCQVAKLIADAKSPEPQAKGELNGVAENLWTITDAAVIKQISELLADVPTYIADGHHRCTTAMNYRDELLEAGKIDADHEANFVMFVLVARNDPGLLVLPTHRSVSGLADDFSIEKFVETTTDFTWEKISAEGVDLADADAFLSKYGKGAMAVVGSGAKDMWIGKLNNAEAMAQAAPEEVEAWRNLDVSILHKILIEKGLAAWTTDDTKIDYTPEGNVAIAWCKDNKVQISICLQSTPMEAIEEIADAKSSMPHKSTYFYPKLATGIVWKPVE